MAQELLANELPAQLKAELQQAVSQGSICIDGISYTQFNTGIPVFHGNDSVRVDRGNLPANRRIKGTSLFGTSIAVAQDGTCAEVNFGGVISSMPLNDHPVVVYRPVFPAIIEVGRLLLVPHELKAMLPSAKDSRVVGLSQMQHYFGYNPEKKYSALRSLAMQTVDLRGRKIVEFGTGAGNKLTEAAALGAEALMGLELPGTLPEPNLSLQRDLQLNLPNLIPAAIIERDVRHKSVAGSALVKLWQSQISADTLPDTAFLSLGPSYDESTDMDLSPHISSLETVFATPSIDLAIVSGHAEEYKPNTTTMLPVSHYRENDRLARNILREMYKNIRTFSWGKIQIIVASERKRR